MQLISRLEPFASIATWAKWVVADHIVWDISGKFQKMAMLNRYRISGANNPILLSIPLEKGRDQQTPLADVRIFQEENWQLRHWRTLSSVYRNTPFWEYYEPTLIELFEEKFASLFEFNFLSFLWVAKQIDWKGETTVAQELFIDRQAVNSNVRVNENTDNPFPRYYQIFEDRIGYQTNLSILDLLFSEGSGTRSWLLANGAALQQFG